MKNLIFIFVLVVSYITTGQEITLTTGLRYQIDYVEAIGDPEIYKNLSTHLVPSIELEYHKNSYVTQISFGYYEGGSEFSHSSSTGHADLHFLPYVPPYSYTRDSWMNEQYYGYLSTRLAFSGRFFRGSMINFDLGAYLSTDWLIKSGGSDYTHIHKEGVTGSTAPNGTYFPGWENSTTSYEPFELMGFSKIFAFAGIRLAPQVKIKKQFVLGLELDVKFQWMNRGTNLNYNYYSSSSEGTRHGWLAFDWAFRLGYTFKTKKS